MPPATRMRSVRPTAIECRPDGLRLTGVAAVALPVWPDGPTVGPGAADVASEFGLDLLEALERESKTGKAGELVSLPGRGEVARVLLLGMGDGSPGAYRKAGAAMARAARGLPRAATSAVAGAGDAELRAFVEGALLAPYAWRTRGRSKAPVETLVLAGTEPSPALDRGVAVGRATWLARDLVHTPSNIKDPAWLADRARAMAGESGLEVRVRDERELAADGFGGIVAVGAGSARAPRLVELRYAPPGAGPGTPHVVLVGKGITYDTGGLSLKRKGMAPMKTDMSGGAVVIGVLSALGAVGCAVRVTGLVPAAENMPSGAAQRPGDVIRQYDGTTVEVRNTDAEGRLVLADAMGYAVESLSPTMIVDVATLTGAATTALGRRDAPLYATSDSLAARLVAAGAAAGERLWRMPLVDDYRAALESAVADVSHVETRKVGAGSITAALFLERFAGGVPWAHLDIAGTGRADADEHEIVKGGTAFGTRTLLYWLEALPAEAAH